eukprot:11809849-Prorocentrum_lima.AAC.1
MFGIFTEERETWRGNRGAARVELRDPVRREEAIRAEELPPIPPREHVAARPLDEQVEVLDGRLVTRKSRHPEAR